MNDGIEKSQDKPHDDVGLPLFYIDSEVSDLEEIYTPFEQDQHKSIDEDVYQSKRDPFQRESHNRKNWFYDGIEQRKDNRKKNISFPAGRNIKSTSHVWAQNGFVFCTQNPKEYGIETERNEGAKNEMHEECLVTREVVLLEIILIFSGKKSKFIQHETNYCCESRDGYHLGAGSSSR